MATRKKTLVRFQHNEPMICLPYGAMAEIDCEMKIENGYFTVVG